MLLRERNFRWFFLGQCASLLGDAMVAPALAFAVLGVTGHISDLGLVLAASAAPQVLLTLAGGVIADRLPRHALMVGSDLVRAVSQGLMAVLLISGAARVWHLLLLQVVHGSAAAMFVPALPGIVQATTRPEQRQHANALRVLAQSTSMIAGPIAAGVLVVTAEPGWAIAVDAATFGASAACLSRIRLRYRAPDGGCPSARDLADGWREFRSRRWVWSVVGAASMVNLLYAAFSVLGPVVSARSFGGADAWALIYATFGAGCLGGGVIALCVRPRFPLRSGVTAMVAFACPTLALAAGLTMRAVAVAAFCGGLVVMLFNTLWETALQQHIPASTVSRVSAYGLVGSIACQPIGLALVAPIAGLLGTYATLWAAGALQIVAVLTPLLFPEVRTLASRTAPAPPFSAPSRLKGVAQLRIVLAQANATVGDLARNADLVIEWTRRSAERGAHLVVFPEMFLTGYPVEDLVLRTSFVDASIATLEATARRLADEGLGEIAVVVGYIDRRADVVDRVGQPAGAPLDAAALLHRGRVVVRTAKHHLPNYGVFDEYRYFIRGDRLPVFRLHGVDIAIAVCEDLWQDGGPVTVTRDAGAQLLVVPNASPYERNKDDVRLELCARRAREAGCALAYVNLIGGQDELVFDGDSIIVSGSGELLARGPQFREDLLVADLELPPAPPEFTPGETPADGRDGTTITIERLLLSAEPLPAYPPEPLPRAEPLGDLGEVYAALVLAVRDYVRKNGFRSVILGLSGGIDSALVATIAADAIGPENVHAVLMPSRYSSDHSITDAEELVKRQGIQARTVPIRGIVDAFESEVDLHGLAAENLQARVRGTLLMGLSNEHGHLVLTTGNKSELATGYSTLYGDSAGGFGPIKDVPKTTVFALSEWRNAQTAGVPPFIRPSQVAPIPQHIIDKPPSAELRPGQLDTDSLPPYEVLDALLDGYVEKDMGHDALIAAGHDLELVERVIRLVDAAEYKRRQYPPGPKITPKNFGRDRRLPITNRWREIAAPHTVDPARVAPRQRAEGA